MAFDVSVLGFGDNVVDVYEHLRTMFPGGNATNFAVYAKKAGAARSAYMGIFGNDVEAEHVIASLEEEGVELWKCRQMIGVNGKARVTVVDGDRVFLGSNEGGVRGDARYVLDRFDLDYIKSFDVVHTGNYCFTERELPKIKEAGVPVSFDFSDDSADEYYEQIAPYVDFAFMSCGDMPVEDIKARLEYVSSLGPTFASATRGAEGCIAYDGTDFYVQPSKPVERMADAMGAGDSFLTSFLVVYLDRTKHGAASKDAIVEALDFAAGFASGVCGIDGSWGHGLAY
jgi:sugar/nucleoside kinase (ribokinase family)